MTQYLWDTSHYDGPLSVATLRTAHAQGIVALTHKVGEGTGGDDPLDGSVLANARDAGIPLLGGYHVVRSGPVGPQVDTLLALADRDEPWWRSWPGWFWQVDLERWPNDNVPAATGIAFGQELRRRTGRVVVLYASRGEYGDQLRAWDGPLWNAQYVDRGGLDFRRLYPGDSWVGWSAYSGREPDFLQYSSSATIAGVTTSDISAYRGTLAELTALLTGGDDMLTTAQDNALAEIWAAVKGLRDGADAPATSTHPAGPVWLVTRVEAIEAAVAAVVAPQVDASAVAAALAGNAAFLAALATAVNDDAARRLAG